MTLEANIARPFDEAAQITLGLNVAANAEITGILGVAYNATQQRNNTTFNALRCTVWLKHENEKTNGGAWVWYEASCDGGADLAEEVLVFGVESFSGLLLDRGRGFGGCGDLLCLWFACLRH